MISVIIPTLNEEKLLPQCLGQFTAEIKQKFGIEIIVSDGGSTDATVEIATKYADKVLGKADSSELIADSNNIPLSAISYQLSASRQTIAEGRNLGAAKAEGDILVFLNADTIIPNIESFFELSTQHLALSTNLVALAVKVEVISSERKLSDTIFHAFFNRYVSLLNLVGIAMGRGECQIVRREAFKKVGGYNESLAAGEDFEFYKRLSKFGKIRYDPKLLVYESPRRYRKYGYPKVYAQWVMNAFSILFTKKAASKAWEEVR